MLRLKTVLNYLINLFYPIINPSYDLKMVDYSLNNSLKEFVKIYFRNNTIFRELFSFLFPRSKKEMEG